MSTVLTPTVGIPIVVMISSLNNLNTSGYLSAIIDNRTLKASDFNLLFRSIMASVTPANDKCISIYAIPRMWDGSMWVAGSDLGTTQIIGENTGSYSFSSLNNLGSPLMLLNYATSGQNIAGYSKLSNRFGGVIPDGFQFFIVNYTGTQLTSASILLTPVTFVSL